MFINNSFVLNKAKHYLEKQPNVLARTRQKIPPSGKRETRRNKKKEKSNEFITKIRKRKCQKGEKSQNSRKSSCWRWARWWSKRRRKMPGEWEVHHLNHSISSPPASTTAALGSCWAATSPHSTCFTKCYMPKTFTNRGAAQQGFYCMPLHSSPSSSCITLDLGYCL
jgi:hypothetical protein